MAPKTSLLATLLAGVGLSATQLQACTTPFGSAAKKRRPKRHKKVYAKHTRGW